MQEERRLLYVGITRAKDRLYLVNAQNRNLYGFPEPVDPSRYLDDIPADLLDGHQPVHSRRILGLRQSSPERWQSGESSAEIITQRFHPGMRVLHPVWEEGMVLNSRIEDDDEVVDIFFENVGLKRVAASIAKLEIAT